MPKFVTIGYGDETGYKRTPLVETIRAGSSVGYGEGVVLGVAKRLVKLT